MLQKAISMGKQTDLFKSTENKILKSHLGSKIILKFTTKEYETVLQS